MNKPVVLSHPDAVLLREGRELDEWLKRYTVPLFFFKGEIEGRNLSGNGSGVLVKIGKSRFILTAGHCVRDWINASRVVVGIASHNHVFSPRILCRDYRFVEKCEDYGFVEIHPEDAGQIEACSKVFMAPTRIEIQLADELIKRDDWLVVSGYPRALVEPVGNMNDPAGHGVRLLHVVSTVFGGETCPADLAPIPPACDVAVDVWIPEDGNLDTMSGNFEEIRLPQLAGMSGAGCWLSGVRPTPENWVPDKMKLVAIHCGTFPELFSSGEENRLMREVLVANHLRLIVENLPYLREEIFSNWPTLSTQS